MELGLLVVAWVAIGAAVGVADARRGHWSKSWLVGAVLGPVFIPVAIAGHRRELEAVSRTIRRGEVAHDGALDVVVGVDGSAASLAAVGATQRFFGNQIGRLALVAVVDFDSATASPDAALAPGPAPEVIEAEVALREASKEAVKFYGFEPDVVMGAGSPAHSLQHYAVDHGFDVVVVGRRQQGWSTRILSSCASRLAARTEVPGGRRPRTDGHARRRAGRRMTLMRREAGPGPGGPSATGSRPVPSRCRAGIR